MRDSPLEARAQKTHHFTKVPHAMSSIKTKPPEECANCGAKIPRDARSCPECGADERTGWRDTGEIEYGALDLPESAYADEDDGGNATGAGGAHGGRKVNGMAWYWWVVAVGLLALFGLGALRLL